MRIGVVILNFNSWNITEKLAKKVESYVAINEIVVIDNVSTDDSYEHLKQLKSSKIEVIQSKKNGGYSYGNNFGIKILAEHGCDVAFVLNPDVDVEERSIEEILNEFAVRTEYAILTGVEYDIDGNISNPPIWNINGYWDDLKDCFYLGRRIKREEISIDYTKEVQPVSIVKGSFFAIRIEDFINICGFDENVFLFCEERIISRKILDSGKRIGLVTSAKYNHNHSTSIKKEYRSIAKQIKLLYNSRYYYNCKYNNIGILKKIILLFGMKISLVEYTVADIIKKFSGDN